MAIIKIIKALRCGFSWLVVHEDEPDTLKGIDMKNIYDFRDCEFSNVVSTTESDQLNQRTKVKKNVVKELYKEQEASCGYCFKDISREEYHVDHIIPISFGGNSKKGNLIITCVKCNLKKSNKLFPNLHTIREYVKDWD